MRRKATIACLAGAGTAPELMAEAAVAVQAVAHVHGVAVDDVHAPFGAAAVARAGQPFPAATRDVVLAADAVLVAGAEDPALAEVMAELDLRARVTRVRFGHGNDVAFVAPFRPSASEWSLDAAFEIAESRGLRLAVVGDADWHDLAGEMAGRHEHVRVECLSPRVAVPLAAFDAGRFDVVAVDERWAESIIEIAAAAAPARVAAHGLLAEHGPSLFMPSPEGGFALAGEAGSNTRTARERRGSRQSEQHAARGRARPRVRPARAGRGGHARRRGLGRARRRAAHTGSAPPRPRRDHSGVHRPRPRRVPALAPQRRVLGGTRRMNARLRLARVGEPMVPRRTPSFFAAVGDSLLRSGESAVSPPRAAGGLFFDLDKRTAPTGGHL
jgi:hypothetical protein